jgi:hypothetical protein
MAKRQGVTTSRQIVGVRWFELWIASSRRMESREPQAAPEIMCRLT